MEEKEKIKVIKKCSFNAEKEKYREESKVELCRRIDYRIEIFYRNSGYFRFKINIIKHLVDPDDNKKFGDGGIMFDDQMLVDLIEIYKKAGWCIDYDENNKDLTFK